jgi:4'-phosphopantetheinyl transferase
VSSLFLSECLRKILTGAILACTSLELQHFHSHDLTLDAFTYARQIGIDVEYIRLDNGVGDYEQLAQHYFSAYERNVLLMLPTEESRQAFFQCWTRKEAYIKAKGTSLSLPFDLFDVSLRPNEPTALLQNRENPQEAARWCACCRGR